MSEDEKHSAGPRSGLLCQWFPPRTGTQGRVHQDKGLFRVFSTHLQHMGSDSSHLPYYAQVGKKVGRGRSRSEGCRKLG